MVLNEEIEQWKEDQRFCDVADLILKTLVEKQISVQDSLRVLKKATRAIEMSIQFAHWESR